MTTIIVATDGSATAERAARVGADIAHARNAAVLLLTVIDVDRAVPDVIRAMMEENVVDGPMPADPETPYGDTPGQASAEIGAVHLNRQGIADCSAIAAVALDRARAVLDEAGVSPVSELVLAGNSVEIIAEVARREGADLIVLAIRELGRLQHLIHGSTSTRVSRQTDCFCVTVT